uniref:Mitochondrial assembly of ribosomal large subunit protein 1 n=1 Tax=Simocephalus serrulatus TaxID=117539 RepID=A0A4Y7NMC3_9CRUS|nr:EOG090X0AI9 [Simocephalus serrulatus]
MQRRTTIFHVLNHAKSMITKKEDDSYRNFFPYLGIELIRKGRIKLKTNVLVEQSDIIYAKIEASLSGSVRPYKQIKHDDTDNLFDQEDWQRIGDSEEIEEIDDFRGVSLQRGVTGVFDIEDLVEILNQENLIDVAVLAVPPQLNYVDYMVITTGKSAKQMTAVAEFVRKVFKKRCLPTDSLPVIEGKNNKDWIALDLGNIALHIFSSKARKTYDLETLWTCGADFDDLSNQEDALSILMKEHTFPSPKA